MRLTGLSASLRSLSFTSYSIRKIFLMFQEVEDKERKQVRELRAPAT